MKREWDDESGAGGARYWEVMDEFIVKSCVCVCARARGFFFFFIKRDENEKK